MLLERIIAASVEMRDADLVVRIAKDRPQPADGKESWETAAEGALRALARGEAKRVRDEWQRLLEALPGQPLLYLPVAREGIL